MAARDGMIENAALIALATIGAGGCARSAGWRSVGAAALCARRVKGLVDLPADYDPEAVAEELRRVEEANASWMRGEPRVTTNVMSRCQGSPLARMIGGRAEPDRHRCASLSEVVNEPRPSGEGG